MPWNPRSFKKHNPKLSGEALRGAAEAATNALNHGASEGSAVRIGNAVGDRIKAKHARKKG